MAIVLLVNTIAMLHLQQATAASVGAQEQQKPRKMIERDADSEVWDNGNGTYTSILGAPQWTYDSQQGKYVPHKVTVIDSQHVNVQSGLIGWKIGPNNATITDANMTEDRVNEQWIVQVGKAQIPLTFESQSVVDSTAFGVNVTNTYSAEYNGSPLTVTILYSIPDGSPAQRIVDIQGLDAKDYKNLRYLRQWTPLTDIDNVDVDGTMDTVTTTTKSKAATAELKDHASFTKGGKTIVRENLKTADDFIEKVDYKKDSIVFTYSKFVDSSRLVDGTLTFTPDFFDGFVATSSSTSTTCPSGGGIIRSTGGFDLTASIQPSSSSGACTRGFAEWDISSIPAGSTVSQIDFKFQVVSISNPTNCDIMPMVQNGTDPHSMTATSLWTEAGDGTAYVSNDSTCTTTGTNKSLTLGGSANTDLQNQISAGYFAIAVKLTSETRNSVRHETDLASHQVGGTPDPTLIVTFTPPTVTQPISISNASGSDTFETAGTSATITCTGGGGTHDGNPASQDFTCNNSVTVTVALPSATSTVRWMWSDGTTSNKTFTSCSSGTCSTQSYTYYKQVAITITASGLDSNKTATATRTQAGTAGSSDVPGSTATKVWADQNSTVTFNNSTITVAANQERFQSYNSTSSRSITADSAQSKTYVYQHEFYTQFAVHEEHLGVIFDPMPTSSYITTVTTANGTTITGTFNSDPDLDDLSVIDYQWVKNGTQTFSGIAWRGLIVRPSGATCDVTTYGLCEVDTYSAHLGYGPPYHHFRLGTDGQTAPMAGTSFDQNTATLTFNATSSGVHTTKVEFINGDYGAVNRVTVDGIDLDSINWSVATIDSLTNILTINNVDFSTNQFVIYFSTSGTSGGSGSTGTTGGSGGGGGGILPVTPEVPGSVVDSIQVSVPPFSVKPGESQTQQITIKWVGALKIVVQSITFSSDQSIFHLGRQTPFALVGAGGAGENTAEVPLTVSLSSDAQGIEKEVDMQVKATTGASSASQTVPVLINISPSNDLALYVGGGIVVLLAGGAALHKLKRRRR